MAYICALGLKSRIGLAAASIFIATQRQQTCQHHKADELALCVTMCCSVHMPGMCPFLTTLAKPELPS